MRPRLRHLTLKLWTGWLILISLFMPLILCVTVAVSVGIGVVAAYLAVIGILHSFGRAAQQPRPQQPPQQDLPRRSEGRPRLILVPTQHHAGGD